MAFEPVVHTTTIWSKAFWQGAGERAIKTFAQAFIAVFGVGTVADVGGVTLSAETWLLALVSGLAAAFLSVCMSVASPGFTAGETALAAGAVPYAPVPDAAAGIPDGTGEHRAEPAGFTVADDPDSDLAPVVTETTVEVP